MKIKTKKVYYCDYCKKHALRNLTAHEKHCTLNPNRVCKLCELLSGNTSESNNIPELIEKYKKIVETYKNATNELDEKTLIKELKEDTGGCPNCVLTVLRCTGFHTFEYDYKKDMKDFWENYNLSNRPDY